VADTVSQQRITRDDIEAKLREVQLGVEETVAAKRNTVVTAAGVGALVLLILVYLLGRRAGKKRTTLVEIRRL
jgi:hypothetical protein